jgi:hypothetical protein
MTNTTDTAARAAFLATLRAEYARIRAEYVVAAQILDLARSEYAVAAYKSLCDTAIAVGLVPAIVFAA